MGEYLNTRGLAEYIDINEKKIYSLILQKGLPASKVTGKWLFSKMKVDDWIRENTQNLPKIKKYIKDVLMITGSNDPAFINLISELNRKAIQLTPYISTTGSLSGLKILNLSRAHMCCSHLLDIKGSDYNIPFVNKYLKNKKVVVINFVLREQGIIFKKDNPFKITSIKDIDNSGITFINRQTGSGTRNLLDTLLKLNNIDAKKINGYENEVMTHLEVGIKILVGEADMGICIKAIAKKLNLGFKPLKEERFDIIIDKEYYFLNEVQMMIELMKTKEFKDRTEGFGGYDSSNTGKIIFSN